jgi:hypothetical protein
MRACGSDNQICPPASGAPITVHTGFYTADYSIQACPPGQYRNISGLQVDPSLTGVKNPSPSLITNSIDFSAIDTSVVTPACQLCPVGTYKSYRYEHTSIYMYIYTNIFSYFYMYMCIFDMYVYVNVHWKPNSYHKFIINFSN